MFDFHCPKFKQIYVVSQVQLNVVIKKRLADYITCVFLLCFGYKLFVFHISFSAQTHPEAHTSLLNTNLAVILKGCLSHWNFKPKQLLCANLNKP